MAFTGKLPNARCCHSTVYDNIPAPPQNLAIFELSGYNYRTIPVWFDQTGQRMMNLQFSMDYKNLMYRWIFYRKEGDLCDSVFHLSTSDDIFPTIFEVTSGKKMKVKRMSRHNGYTSWEIRC